MERKFSLIISLGALLLTLFVFIFSLVCIYKVNETNDNLTNHINILKGKIQTLQSDIHYINSNIREELKKQSSIITSYKIDIGEVNVDDLTVAVTIEVTPKELAEDTEVELTIGKTNVVAEKTNNVYIVKTQVDALKNHEVLVSVKTNGVAKTEKLERQVDTRWLFQEKAKGVLDGNIIYKKNKLTLEENYLSLFYNPFENSEIKKARIYITIDDKEVWEQDITEDLRNAKNTITYTISKSFDVNPGSTLNVFAEIEEDNGLIYRLFLRGVEAIKDGRITHIEHVDSFTIFDKDGNMINLRW